MKIVSITPYEIIFDNDNKIYYRNPEEEAINYADFEYLVEEQNGEIYNIVFPTELKFVKDLVSFLIWSFYFSSALLLYPNGYYSDKIKIRYLCNGLHRDVIDTLKTQLIGEDAFITKKNRTVKDA